MSLHRQLGDESVQVMFRVKEPEMDESLEQRNRLYFDEMGRLESNYHVYPSNVSDYYRKTIHDS